MAIISRRYGYSTQGIYLEWAKYTTGIEDMMIEMGVPYEFPKNYILKQKNAEAL